MIFIFSKKVNKLVNSPPLNLNGFTYRIIPHSILSMHQVWTCGTRPLEYLIHHNSNGQRGACYAKHCSMARHQVFLFFYLINAVKNYTETHLLKCHVTLPIEKQEKNIVALLQFLKNLSLPQALIYLEACISWKIDVRVT